MIIKQILRLRRSLVVPVRVQRRACTSRDTSVAGCDLPVRCGNPPLVHQPYESTLAFARIERLRSARSSCAGCFSASAGMPRQARRQFGKVHHGSQGRIDRFGIGKRLRKFGLNQHEIRSFCFQASCVPAPPRFGEIKIIFRAQIIASSLRCAAFFRLHSVFSLWRLPRGR